MDTSIVGQCKNSPLVITCRREKIQVAPTFTTELSATHRPWERRIIVFSCEPNVEPIRLHSVASKTQTVRVKLGWSQNRTNRLEYERDLCGEDRVERADIYIYIWEKLGVRVVSELWFKNKFTRKRRNLCTERPKLGSMSSVQEEMNGMSDFYIFFTWKPWKHIQLQVKDHVSHHMPDNTTQELLSDLGTQKHFWSQSWMNECKVCCSLKYSTCDVSTVPSCTQLLLLPPEHWKPSQGKGIR